MFVDVVLIALNFRQSFAIIDLCNFFAPFNVREFTSISGVVDCFEALLASNVKMDFRATQYAAFQMEN